ncbi:MAG TPA: TVP38/TMEM64 family protein [Solirubrobacter sp.]|nr:TVP38/TMEM64 family protein [Solirubrobacter sp.]
MSDVRESEPPGARRAAWLRIALLVGAVGALAVLAALALPHSPAGLVAAVAVWALVTPALFSGTVLALAAGLLFGPLKGAGVGVLGATAGGLLAFAIARRAGRGAVEALTGPRLDKTLRKIERRGFAAVLVARLAPGVPATLLNYAAGLTRVRARHFAAAIAVGGAPRAFAYAALGGSGGDLMSPAALAGFALLAALTLGGVAVGWRARRR